MPIDHINRNSALGSHAPFANLSTEQFEAKPKKPPVETKQARGRRATLPSVFINPVKSSSEHAIPNGRTDQDEGQNVDPSNIGFAVTSGSNPKRRSRSADALYDVVKAQHQVSIVHQRHESSRSEEIKYWRYSVGPVPKFDFGPKDDVSSLHEDEEHQDQPESTAEAHDEVSEPSENSNSVNRGTFDFGVLATAIQKQEDISIEERVVTLEVKLMDLEYAISKLQANAPSSTGPSPQHLQPTAITPRKGSPDVRVHTPSQPTRNSPQSDSRSHQADESTMSGSTAVQNSAYMSTPSKGGEPLRSSPARPTSTATTVRAVEASSNPSPSPIPEKRTSITTLTIDHYSTLISLIRREQAARKILEEQIYDLRRQVQVLKGAPSVSSSLHSANGSLYRPGWGTGHEAARRMPSYDDESTEDGYQDVFETPVEQQRREFEGGNFGRLSGEAF